MNGNARTPSGTGLLLTPEGPELDIPCLHAEVCHEKSPEAR